VAGWIPRTSIEKYVSKDINSCRGKISFRLLENGSVESMYLLQQHAIDYIFLVTGPEHVFCLLFLPRNPIATVVTYTTFSGSV